MLDQGIFNKVAPSLPDWECRFHRSQIEADIRQHRAHFVNFSLVAVARTRSITRTSTTFA